MSTQRMTFSGAGAGLDYGDFGAVVNNTAKTVRFRLFFPDHTKDNTQYFEEYIIKDDEGRIITVDRGGLPRIKDIEIVGNFPVRTHKMMAPVPFPGRNPSGLLYESEPVRLWEGFHLYSYLITFQSGETRLCNDPCAKYCSRQNGRDRSAFVIGGCDMKAVSIKNRLPHKELIVYEMNIDDFTDALIHHQSPLDVIKKKIDYLVELGVNTVEFLPVTAWPGWGFNCSCMPFLYFAVTNRYTQSDTEPLEKLSKLKMVINELHNKGIHVLMDGVFKHVFDEFPYYQLYENRDLSPFVGIYGETAFGKDLSFYNKCTQEFVFNICRYWIDEFKTDGIHFDYACGFDDDSDQNRGITELISKLNEYVRRRGERNISFIKGCGHQNLLGADLKAEYSMCS